MPSRVPSSGVSGRQQQVLDVFVQDEGIDVTKRPIVNFVGSGVSVADLGGKTVVTVGGLYEFSLRGALSIGATTCTLDRPVGALLSGRDLLIIVDPFTINCEIRQCSILSGSTVTFQSALTFAHSSEVAVYFIPDDSVSAALWGAIGANNNSQDDWAAIQAGINQCSLNDLWLMSLSAGANKHLVYQPMFGSTGFRMRGGTYKAVNSVSVFAPADATNAMLMSAQGSWQTFTATASDDKITTPTPHGMVAGQKFSVNGPQGQSLPGSIVSGRVYVVLTAPTTTTLTFGSATLLTVKAAGGEATITVADTTEFAASGSIKLGSSTVTYTGKTSTTFTGCSGVPAASAQSLIYNLSTFDITSDGNGIIYASINALERGKIHDVYLAGNSVSGINGASFYWQQPAYSIGLRIDGCINNLILSGQISNHWNCELGTLSGSAGLQLSGTGHNFHGFNVTGAGEGIQLGIGLQNYADQCSFYAFWTEQNSVMIHLIGASRGIVLAGWEPSFGSGDIGILIDAAVGTAQRSYTILGARFTSSGETAIKDDTLGITVLQSRFPQQTITMVRQEAGGGHPSLYQLNGSASLNFGSITAQSTLAGPSTITVTGATVGDIVTVSTSDALESGLIAQAYVSSTNNVTVTLTNVTGSSIDPAAHTFTVAVEGLG